MRISVLFCLAFGFSAPVMAVTTAPCLKGSVLQQASGIQKISVIGSEDRMTIAQYAKKNGLSIEAANLKFSATGKIVCPGGIATAQLTGRKNLITTVGHVFFDKNCNPLPVENCYFETTFGKDRKIKVNPSKAKIHDCSLKYSRDDWAVVELSEEVQDARPYLVPVEPVIPTPGQTLIQVSAYAKNFVRSGKMPKNVVECTVRDVAKFNGTPIQTDCDTGLGSSGSAQLAESKEGLVLQSINSWETLSGDGHPYDSDSNFNSSAVVNEEFFDALQSMKDK